MTTNADNDGLLEEYAAAVSEERLAWQQWKDPEFKESERDAAYLRWKNAAGWSKALALRLTALKFDQPPRG